MNEYSKNIVQVKLQNQKDYTTNSYKRHPRFTAEPHTNYYNCEFEEISNSILQWSMIRILTLKHIMAHANNDKDHYSTKPTIFDGEKFEY